MFQKLIHQKTRTYFM